jgi:maltose O-acetyltransferase
MEIGGLSEKLKMLRGELYNATDRELVVERQNAESQLALLNGSNDPKERVALLRGLLGAMGEETVVRSPFSATTGTTSIWAAASSSTSTAFCLT